MEKKKMICIVCPLGCQLEVAKDGGSSTGYRVEGNKCSRGEAYGIKEMTNPTRVLTTTVKLKNACLKRLPVRTDAPVPKDLITGCMKELNGVEASAPLEAGTVLVRNILNTGANVIATRSI